MPIALTAEPEQQLAAEPSRCPSQEPPMGNKSNVCAVRTLKNQITKAYDVRFLRAEDLLPHEPKSDHRFVMWLQPQNAYWNTLPNSAVGTYAECIHCGSVYSAHIEEET